MSDTVNLQPKRIQVALSGSGFLPERAVVLRL